MCFKKKKKTTTVTTQAPQQVQDFYNATADATKKAAAKPFVSYGTQASDYVAPLTEQQRAGMAGVNATIGGYKPYMQAGVNATNAGLGYMNTGMGVAAGGLNSMGAGMNTIGQGLGVAGSGLSNMNAGSDYINQGMGTVGQGTQYIGQGAGAVNQGMGVAGSGLSNINTGSDYINQGMGTVGQGTAYVGQGMNAANQGMESVSQGTEATQAGMGPANLGSLDIQKYLSPYLSEVRDSTAALMNQANNQAQSQALGTAISSGAFGGDRAGIAAANLNQQNQLAMANSMANIGNQGYQFATTTAQGQQTADLAARQANLQRMLDAGAQFGQLGATRGQLGATMGTLGAQQGELGTAMGNLGAQQGTLGTQRAQIGTAIGNMGAQLGTLGEQQGGLGTVMGNLGAQQTAVGSAKGTLGTQIGQMGTAQANIGEQQGNLGNTMSNIGTNVMGAGKQLAGFGTEQQRLDLEAAGAQMNAGAVQQQNQQAGVDAMINRFMQEQGYDFQTAQFLANQYATIGPLYGSTTATTRPTNIFGNPVKTGGRVNGYAKGGGIAGPMTMSQLPLYEESYIPERIFSASPLLTGEEAEQAQKKGGNFISDALKIAAMFGGKAGGGAVDDRHGYALDGGVSYPALTTEELRREQELRKQFAAGTEIIDDLNKDYLMSSRTNPANMGLAGHQAPYGPKHLLVEGYEQSPAFIANQKYQGENRNTIELRKGLKERGFPNSGYQDILTDRLMQHSTNPANMGFGAGKSFGVPYQAHPYPPSPTTGVAPTSDAAPITSMRPPPPRPEGLGAADVAEPTTSMRPPPPRPEGLGAADVAADTMRTIQVEPAPSDGLGGVKPVHIPTDWDAAKAKIIPRESGNDPNALLGFANREGGAFAGTNITDMTVDQAIEFARVGGPYANYSKTQTEDGRVATPMGLYQIVGGTLADAKNAMGLTGDEKMTADLQESIAKHLYDTRGMQPWAASEGKTGGLGDARMPPSDGLARADMSQQGNDPLHINKPYEDRNLIGKFFHEKDTGKLDRNAIMSLLSGIGGMVSSDSMSPLTALLQGAAVGSDTYKGLLKQTADVEATNLANAQNAMKNYSYAVYNGMTDMSWPEYAAQQGIDLTALRGVPTLMGQPPIKPITVADTRSVVTRNIKGVDYQIPFMQDLQSLNDLINKNVGAQSDPENPMSQVVQQAIKARDQIMESGSTTDVNGNKVEVPAAINAQNQVASTEMMQGQREKFKNDSINSQAATNSMNNTLDNMSQVMLGMKPGPEARSGAIMGAWAQALGIDTNNLPTFMSNPDAYVSADKESALLQKSNLEALPGGAPATSIEFAGSFTPSPDMPPAAMRDIMVKMKANNAYLMEYYNGFDEWAKDHPNQETDIKAYQDEFSSNRNQRYQELLSKANAEVPHFMGDPPPTVTITQYDAPSVTNEQRQLFWKFYERDRAEAAARLARGI